MPWTDCSDVPKHRWDWLYVTKRKSGVIAQTAPSGFTKLTPFRTERSFAREEISRDEPSRWKEMIRMMRTMKTIPRSLQSPSMMTNFHKNWNSWNYYLKNDVSSNFTQVLLWPNPYFRTTSNAFNLKRLRQNSRTAGHVFVWSIPSISDGQSKEHLINHGYVVASSSGG